MSLTFFPQTHIYVFFVVLLSFKSMILMEAVALSIETDKESLLAFKSQLSLNNPNSLSSWQPSSSPCNWTGVSCNNYGQRVVGLNLSGMGISGSVSPYIGNLSFLGSLQLQNNQFSGTFPDEICNLFRLQVLNLSSNNLQGSLPLNISSFSNLEVLDLSMNKIAGKIPDQITSLANLQVLNLGRNLFSGSIPSSISNLSSLEELVLGTNQLSGSIPGDLSRLRVLKVLDLTINNLKGSVPSAIYNMSSLVNLALASNQLWGEIPSDIGITLPNLLIFNFCINKFTGRIPGSLHNLTNIKVIRMADNFLEGTVPPGLGNLPFLEMYNIGFNKIISSGDDGLGFITSLANSTRLQFLAIDGNLLQGVLPESIGNLSKDLSKLYMGGNRIHGEIPSSVSSLSSLTLLNLSYNSISGAIPEQIGQLMNLQTLSLAGNELSGGIPDSLGNLQKLNHIDLSKNELAGGIPPSFGNFQRLLSMDLSKNKLNQSIPREILNLPSLSTIMNLSNNFLTGNLSDDIGFLENVVTIDLSNNLLSGNIPILIQNCKSLERLYMARNSFSGPLPASFGDIRGLEILDLSHNHLSGSIPPELETLQALQSLNLSFNNLEGVVPCGGVFSNTSRVKFQGNPKLSLHNLGCPNAGGRQRNLSNVWIAIISIMATLALCFIAGSLFCIKRRSKAKMGDSDTTSLKKEQHQMVTYQELRQATGNFDERHLIGKGGFGSVYRGQFRDGSDVAIKVLDIKQAASWTSFSAECKALRNVKHRNLVKLITTCSSLDFRNGEFLALVYEFLSNGSLEDWIKGKRKKEDGNGLDFLERLNVMIDVASAMDYLHHDCEIPVVHCDLKPSNVLLMKDMTAKVGDFGMARLLIENTTIGQVSISSTHALKGSIGYIPPEYGLGSKPSTAGDAYSFGVTLLEIFTGKSPADGIFLGEENLIGWVESAFPSNILQVLDPELLGKSAEPEILNDCVTAVIGIGLACTAESPENRISIRNALLKLKAARDCLVRNASTHNNSKYSP